MMMEELWCVMTVQQIQGEVTHNIYIIQKIFILCSSNRSSRQGSSNDDRKVICACQSCMCDIQLANCLHKVNKCPSPLFGILNRKIRK